MKIAVLALSVVLPSICLCTPLPDVSAVVGSDSAAKVTASPGSNVSVGSNSSSNVNVNNPPAVPPTTTVPSTSPSLDTTQPPCNDPPSPPPSPPVQPPCNDPPSPPPSPPVQPPCNDPPSPPPAQPPCTGDDSPPPTTPQSGGDNTTVDASSKSNSKVNVQQGGNGGTSVTANSSSSANVSVTTGGHKCGKGDVDGFDNYTVVVKCQEDYQKLSNTFILWKSTATTTKIETEECVCAPRYWDNSNCKFAEVKITIKSETEMYYEVYGYNGEKILYLKQQLTLISQQYQIYSTKVLSVAEASASSQEVIAVQNKQTITEYFESKTAYFGVLDYDQDYMICTTSSGIVFISVSQQVYESDDLKQQVSQKIEKVLQINNLSSTSFIEVTNKVDVDVTKYQWDNCSQGGSGNNNNGGTNVNVDAKSSSSVDVKNQDNNTPGGDKTNINAGADSHANVDVSKDNNNTPTGGDKTDIKVGADSNANVNVSKDNNNTPTGGDKTDIKVGADSNANVNVSKDNNNTPTGGDKTDIKAGADSNANVNVTKDNNDKGSDGNSGGGSCSGGTGKPTQQGFTNYSVLKISNDEFKSKIDKTTWYVAEYSQVQEEVKTDVTVCADRYICSSCYAVKFQYTQDKGCFVLKEWGYDGTNLLYIQENITFSTQDFVILKADVVNVMKATKDTDVAVGVDNKDQVTSYLSSEYAVLYTDYKNFFIGQTSCDKGSYTFIAFIEEIYTCEEKQQQFADQISKILKENGIDESKLQKLTKEFDVDTNKYNKVKQETNVSPDGKTTNVKQETEHDGSGGKTKTETTVTNGPSAPSGSNVDVDASSKSDAKVDTNQGPTPGSGGTNVNVNASSDANVNVNNGSNPPPCTGTPPPPPPPCSETPPAQPPASPPASPPTTSPPSTITANTSSNSDAKVDTNGGNVKADVTSDSTAAVTANNGSP